MLVFLAGIGFAFLNRTPVGLSLGLWEFPAQPLAFWIITAFASGGGLGLLFGAGITRYLRDRFEIRRLRKQLADAELELDRLRKHS